MNVVHKLDSNSVHKYACGAAYFNTISQEKINTITKLDPMNASPDYEIGDQIIKFSMIFSKLILNDNHVLNPISGKIT